VTQQTRGESMRLSGQQGAAMTETALLCFFLYVPMLMMVIIWGDMTLDKERAHAASSYMAFSREAIDDDMLVDEFFPTATGASDATRSVRTVAVEADDAAPGPTYTLPVPSGDYEGDPPPFDLQYKLYSLAAGEVHVTFELQAMPDGTMQFVGHWRRIEDEVAKYLRVNQIVKVGQFPEGTIELPVGEELDLETGGNSTEHTYYVDALTDVFNGRWDAGGTWAGGTMGYAPPTMESRAGLRTRFTSPFLWELERERFRGPAKEADYIDLNLPRVGGEPGFEMHFGATDLVPQDDSFKGGYTYLGNPDAKPSGERLRCDLYELSRTIFEHEGQAIHEMPDPLSSERGEGHTRFLTPGPPRVPPAD